MDKELYQKVQQAVDKAMLEELEELTLEEECQIIFDLYKEMADIAEIPADDQLEIINSIKHQRQP